MRSAAVFQALVALLFLFSLLWLASLRLANASIVDAWWGPAFVLALFAYLDFDLPDQPRAWLVLGATVLWAARLAWHIGRRNIGHGEDPRYRAWREQHGSRWWWRSYLQVFLLQAVVAWIVSFPLFHAARGVAPFPAGWDVAGAGVFLAGWLWESVADWQLAAFKGDPSNRGLVMNRGLWRYSRHPNYFGEAVLWWGLGLIGASVPGGWTGLIGPMLMTFLLLRVSGVTMLERGLRQSKPGYAEYVERTSAFVPWPPRAPASGIPRQGTRANRATRR
jgi:steroid 5-alpha reductase family enzyme